MNKKIIASIVLILIALGLYSTRGVAQQTTPAPPPAAAVGVTARGLARTENNNMPADFTADLRAFYIAPNGNIPLHYHPGPVTLVVLEGELTYIENGVEKVYRLGESWTEGFGPDHAHELWNKGKTMASFALISMMPKGATLTTFVNK
jgi:quercetin dioxygenase-like cupin family protein